MQNLEPTKAYQPTLFIIRLILSILLYNILIKHRMIGLALVGLGRLLLYSMFPYVILQPTSLLPSPS